MDEQTRRKLCQIIAGIVVVDDDLDPAEDKFVDNLLKRFGLPEEERDALFPIMDAEEAAKELLGQSKEVQAESFDLLVEAAAADKKLAAEERTFLEKVADVLGVPRSELEAKVASALKS
jgi:uncharacterized tellurite resistance protein B-like protein